MCTRRQYAVGNKQWQWILSIIINYACKILDKVFNHWIIENVHVRTCVGVKEVLWWWLINNNNDQMTSICIPILDLHVTRWDESTSLPQKRMRMREKGNQINCRDNDDAKGITYSRGRHKTFNFYFGCVRICDCSGSGTQGDGVGLGS